MVINQWSRFPRGCFLVWIMETFWFTGLGPSTGCSC